MKDMNIENEVQKPEEEVVPCEEVVIIPSFLEINVHDAITGKDIGPGQK